MHVVAALLLVLPSLAAEPLRLHPENPHYFLWRGRPTVLITSGEHYGAVLNRDFDYVTYLDTLAKDRLNLTRTFTGGAYVEPLGAFGIARNTLAPAPGRFICPWARSTQPGYAGGGNKFDLTRWDTAYFERFLDFVKQADKRDIIVEVNLFCPMYGEAQWNLSPFNARNNVNGLGAVGRDDVYTLKKHRGLLAVQERMVRKFVSELRGCDNIYYEIMNEPYARNIPLAWEHHIAGLIADAQKGHRHKKLISRNVANNAAKVENPHPAVSIFNFHYATPPVTVDWNYPLNKVIGDNETGFRGTSDAVYRMEGWDFVIAGGGLYNNLDYSFTVGHEDGTFVYPPKQPGGGSPALRRQLRLLRDFMEGFDFVHMRPDDSIIKGGVPPTLSARALVSPGRAYALYVRPDVVTKFSVRWTGHIIPPDAKKYTFHTFSNDGVRLWIDGKRIINNWTDHGETEDTGTIRLEAKKPYPLKLEYFYNGGQSAMKFWWSSPTRKKAPVPADALRTPGGKEHGLRGEYFRGRNFQRQWRVRIDPQVNFAWGTGSPFAAPESKKPFSLDLAMPPGRYQADWIDPADGKNKKSERFQHRGGIRTLNAPHFTADMALRVKETVNAAREKNPAKETSSRIDVEAIPSPIIIRGNNAVAYRDPAALYHNGTFHLFFTAVRTEEEGKIHSYTATSTSRDLIHWSEPRNITPKGQHLNFSSPGNVVRFGGEWILCLQTYPRPGYRRGGPVKWANQEARVFIMRSTNLRSWSPAELLRVKGPEVPVEKMGRMIDPYLIEDKDTPGKWWCFYKQRGVSMSWSHDLKTWTYLGRTDSGENVCVLVDNNEYLLFHSPRNGIGTKRSKDLKNWRDVGRLITLGQKGWPWAQTRLTAGVVLDLRAEPRLGTCLMFFHAGGPGTKKTQDNVDANCHLGIAWSDDLKTWSWPGKKP